MTAFIRDRCLRLIADPDWDMPERAEAHEQLAAAVDRIDELLRAMVRITNETPFPDEVKNWTEQRAKLVAEIGSLKAALAERDRRIAELTSSESDGCPHMDSSGQSTVFDGECMACGRGFGLLGGP